MLIPDNYGVAAFHHTLGATGELMVTTVGFHNTPIDDALTIATALNTVWGSDMTDLLSDQYTNDGCYVLISIGGVQQSAFFPDGTAGAITLGPVSPAVSVGVKKATSYAGKHYRGRFYLPAGYLPEAHVTAAGVIDGTDVTNLQAAMTNVKNDMNSAGYPMYLLHHDATAPTPINELIVRNQVRTQRRRQRLS